MTSPGQKKLPPNRAKTPTILVDRCLPRSLVDALRKYGLQNTHHIGDIYPNDAEDTPDTEWIKDAGERGYVVLTRDIMVEKNSLEFRQIQEYKAKVFTLTAKNATKDTMGLYIGRQIQNILRRGKREGPAFWSIRGSDDPRRAIP